MKRVWLGFGANIGDRERNIRVAIGRLDAGGVKLIRLSSFYETEPVGFGKQRWFLNCAAEFETELFPLQLLHRIQRIELELGRKREIRNGPRTIDIDILLYGDAIVNAGELEIPHPRFRERRFVLAPLAELEPGLREPVTAKSVAQLLEAVEGQAVRKC